MKNREISLLILIETAVLILVVVFSIGTAVARGTKSDDSGDVAEKTTYREKEEESEAPERETYDEVRLTFDEDVEEALSGMSDEDLLAQMFVVEPEDFTGNPEVTIAGEGCRNAINLVPVGGMVCSEANMIREDASGVNLSNLQTYSTERTGWPLMLFCENEEAAALAGEIACIFSSSSHLGDEEFLMLSAEDGLSADMIRKIRETDGFAGVIVSGDLSEIAQAQDIAQGEAAIRGICAGMTALYVPQGFSEAWEGARQAVQDGTITETMLHNGAGRVLSAKKHRINALLEQQAQQQQQQQQQEQQQRQTSSNRNRNTSNAAQQQAEQPQPQPEEQAPQPEQQPETQPEQPEQQAEQPIQQEVQQPEAQPDAFPGGGE